MTTGTAKPWQIVVVVAALVAVGAALYWSFGRDSGPSMASSITLVDVATGDLYSVSKGLVIPAPNPATGVVSLIPVDQRDGHWFVSQRDLSAVEAGGVSAAAVIDRGAGEVKVSSTSVRRIR